MKSFRLVTLVTLAFGLLVAAPDAAADYTVGHIPHTPGGNGSDLDTVFNLPGADRAHDGRHNTGDLLYRGGGVGG